MRKIEVLVNNETFRILKRKARAEGLSVPDYVVRAIINELERDEGRDVASRLKRIEEKLDTVLERLDGRGRARGRREKAGWEGH
jgi:chromosomal replication initiation ATPase DnaA